MRIVTVVVLSLALLAGCASAATEVRKPPIYPDRASPETAWESFLWAWRNGDVDSLELVFSLWMKEDLDRQIEKNGKAAVSEWYRRDTDGLVIEEAKWVKRTNDLAYLDVRLGTTGGPLDVRFSFLKKDDGWTVSGRKPLH
jgi:hypothetical protein